MNSNAAVQPTGSKISSLADKLGRPRTPTATSAESTTPADPQRGTSSRRTTTTTPPEPPATSVQQESSDTASTPTPAPASDLSTGGTRQVSLLAPAELRDRLRNHRRTNDITARDTILDALEANYERLSDLVSKAAPATRSGPLFTRTIRPTEPSVKVQITVRFTQEEVATIDRLVEETQATDRSTLITTALENYL